jgi:eukaryotic-like serine/threonine-protein kinase
LHPTSAFAGWLFYMSDEAPRAHLTLEFAHVLFMDIVGYSQLSMDEQEKQLRTLQDSVRETREFGDAQVANQLICLPTGDGMALVFFGDPEAPARCAVHLGQMVHGGSAAIRLRMGLHSGPVYRVPDINANRNVAGGGINIAQRVMDCGDAGHILVSPTQAELLAEMGSWKDSLSDLGEVRVKHGVVLHLHNLCRAGVGNSAVPTKIRDARIQLKQAGSDKKLKVRTISVGAVLLVVAGAGIWLFSSHRVHALTDKDTIVLADFTNTTGDSVFDDTLKQALAVDLDQSPFLNILSEDKVRQTLRQMTRKPDERLTQDLAREVCQRAGSKAYLAGSIAALGTQYVIGLEAVNCAGGDVLAREQVTAAGKEQVLAALGQGASKLRNEVGESLNSVQKFDVPLDQATTNSLEALKSHTLGRKTAREKGTAEALPFEKRAIELDPNFALAYEGLGVTYYNLNQPGLAADCLKRAFELRDRVTEREKFGIASLYYTVATGELEKANQTYELWVQAYPRDEVAHSNLGTNYMILGHYEKAATETREALRLEPNFGVGYGNLGEIYLALNRFDEARTATEDAQRRKLEVFPLHLNLYALAFFQSDAAVMKQQADWAIGKPGAEDWMLSLESDTEAWFGRLGKARELSRQAVQRARRSDEKEPAALWQANAAIREALLGNADVARQNAAAAAALAPGSHDAEAQAALAYALAGDAAHAQSLADDLAKRFPQDTLVQSVWLPTIRARIETGRKNPALIELLQAAAPYELGMLSGSAVNSCLYPVYVRAEAHLSAQQSQLAAAEFQKILNHHGLLWNCATGALAHLGLARAYAMQGDTAKARAAYQNFFALWKDADADIPVLIAAKAEYATLK